ncbi:hypothetical protein HYH03_018135 [Edaphochlamys debaryana]|uniref:Uncharacterized protein n=1 Tax=Edaphochlamys debaryana TaxID=47281 RepID=A0A835XF63_9CHLO|nr:hypothetical protein HYH03_018135 [Edaphochlamys debaryana]|eukprot:KAG2482958.1 hypothetical protein HYH03_018135 [Edaphochlamys debaryana]
MASRKAAITLGFAAGAMAKFGTVAALRDTLVGDLSPPGMHSACFGLAQSLRELGSAIAYSFNAVNSPEVVVDANTWPKYAFPKTLQITCK